MKYAKPPLTLEQQADQLLGRGMVGDRDLMIARLRSVSYYRLSGYWFPFRNADDSFKSGTSFDAVWNRYVFDRRLRLLAMDAIERIEHPASRYGFSSQLGTMSNLGCGGSIPSRP